jgi:predicted amidohydrolase
MTRNKNLKRRVRTRMVKTGESYTTALQHLSPVSTEDSNPPSKCLRLAVAQSTQRRDPGNIAELRESGLEIRRLMCDARDASARIVHFPEGATCFPHKPMVSIEGVNTVVPADWARVRWDVLREELAEIAKLARNLRLWTVFGSMHQLTSPHRPHNSLYVLSDEGQLATRYDERMLSHTKINFMYTPGAIPVTFDVDGVRFGCSLGMECHFPEIFIEYERLGVDCVLFSTTGGAPSDPVFATEVQGHAAANTYWISFSAHAQHSEIKPSGVISPSGEWVAHCPQDGKPAVAAVDLEYSSGNGARSWRRTARSALYEPYLVHDDLRSNERDIF